MSESTTAAAEELTHTVAQELKDEIKEEVRPELDLALEKEREAWMSQISVLSATIAESESRLMETLNSITLAMTAQAETIAAIQAAIEAEELETEMEMETPEEECGGGLQEAEIKSEPKEGAAKEKSETSGQAKEEEAAEGRRRRKQTG